MILSSSIIAPISSLNSLRAFGPGLNPFAPFGMGNYSASHMPTEQQQVKTRSCLSSRHLFKQRSRERDDRGWTLLHIGARKGDLKEVKHLLDGGMDVNVTTFGPKAHGVTPLHLAAQGGHIKVMDELLERGANIDARTKGACGWTPLHIAAKERNKKAIKFLVENGAFLPPDMNDNRFNPPLHYCPGLEWAYEIKRKQEDGLSIAGTSYSSES